MSIRHLDAESLSSLLQLVTDEQLQAKKSDLQERPPRAFQAIYTDTDNNTRVTCSFDLTTAVALGATRGEITAEAALSMVQEGEMSASVNISLYEIMDSLSRLFKDDAGDELAFDRMQFDVTPLAALEPASIMAFDIDMGKYGDGVLWFCEYSGAD